MSTPNVVSVVLYQPPGRPWGMPNMSPFCTKVETYLRMAGVAYEARVADPRRAPKGKVPYAEVDGQLVADSQFIIERIEHLRGESMDRWLVPDQRALGHAVRRMLEEGTYFVGVWNRWIDDAGWGALLPEFKKMLPGPLKLATGFIRGKVKSASRAQGTGRHTPAEIQALGRADFEALSTILEDHTYLLGELPSTYDATVFAFVEAIAGFPVENDVRRLVESKHNLLTYRTRMRTKYFPELSGRTARTAG